MEKTTTNDDDVVIWEWKDKLFWVAYDLATSQILETAYCDNRRKIQLDHGVFANGPYNVDFSIMEQTNQRTNFTRKIRRFGEKATRSKAVWACLVKKKWEAYDKNTSEELEKAFCSGQKTITISNRAYTIDFVEMKQTNTVTGFSREIRRQVDAKLSLDSCSPPPGITKYRALPRIRGVTSISPEKLKPCYGTIAINLIEGSHLSSPSFTGSDPYVVITTDFSSVMWKSQWKFKTLNPTWNETFLFTVSKENMEGKITFTVYDHNYVTKSVYLGRMEISLYDIILYQEISGQRDLDYEFRGKSHSDVRGKLNLKIKWTPKPQPQIRKINFRSIVENSSVTYHKTLAQKAATLHGSQLKRNISIYESKEFKDPNVVECASASYKMEETIGEGGYAIVRKGHDTSTNKVVAVKIIRTDIVEDSIEKITREIQILHVIDFTYCVSVIDSCLTKDAIYIIMEFLSGGDLLDAIMKAAFTEEQSKQVLTDIFNGLDYLHAAGICHRDLKPENILHDRENNIWKIADFGCSTFFSSTEHEITGFEGTVQYMAPELFLSDRYTKAVDLWAIGVITYVLLSGLFPWQGESDPEIQEAITNHNIMFYSPEFDNINDNAKEFIMGLLEMDASKRFTIEQSKKHPWMK